MNKYIAASYENQKKKFLKSYGTVHICGDCMHTTLCSRMKVQNSGFNKEKM